MPSIECCPIQKPTIIHSDHPITMHHSHDDNTHNAMSLLALTNSWILIRHQWLIDQVRCILTGEANTPIESIEQYDNIQPADLKLPASLAQTFINTKNDLDALWNATLKTSHPASGLDVFEQLNNFQEAAKNFMQASKTAYQYLWEELAAREPLTGTWSRLTLKSSLIEAINAYQEHKTISTIILIDQNNFKQINDQWGHPIGDHVLIKTGQIIQEQLKPDDKLFRYGGDEWLILMRGSDKAQANHTIDQIQNSLAQHAFETGNSENEKFHVTFSYGVAQIENNTTVENWIEDADYQLYAKKLKFTS